ncbi:hypothetical protein WOLCODRAFT_166181 [Wolfiporia cocos MD-104 SS10]|uniref:Uncharacterized protein n=1 Tax=Wolfiporia cocos (strain MD-104) TaxID=742152 RepID=A0A2H3J0S1_WOLCO|nr:hypothetical protein WOLCODRAFT_166181 [Wolfiporia cocos MD-104 SS10]
MLALRPRQMEARIPFQRGGFAKRTRTGPLYKLPAYPPPVHPGAPLLPRAGDEIAPTRRAMRTHFQHRIPRVWRNQQLAAVGMSSPGLPARGCRQPGEGRPTHPFFIAADRTRVCPSLVMLDPLVIRLTDAAHHAGTAYRGHASQMSSSQDPHALVAVKFG